MNQSNQPSEAVMEAKKLSLKTFPNGSGDTHYDYLQEQRREGYETGFIEGYKYALPTSIPNEGKPKSCAIPCSPSDYYKGGKCDINGCYEEGKQDEYWKQRCEAAEMLISVMNVPRNEPIKSNDQFLLFSERNSIWQKSKYTSKSPVGGEQQEDNQEPALDTHIMLNNLSEHGAKTNPTFTLKQTLQIADNFYNYGYSDHADSERGDSNNNPSKEEYFLKIFGIKINQ